MSKCRCREIKECEEDNSVINNTQPYFNEIVTINNNVNSLLENIASGCKDSFETSYMGEICAAINRLVNPFADEFGIVNTGMSKAKTEIKHKKVNFKLEDESYHAEEAAQRARNALMKEAATNAAKFVINKIK